MKVFFAAAYVGESEGKFRSGVAAGKWPQGIADGGNVYWYLEDLDDRLDQLKPEQESPTRETLYEELRKWSP
jgi:hypothetical protein